MLVLSRKKNEQIVIGGQIVVTVISLSGGRVRLGISAPDDVSVHRAEVYDRICLESKSDVLDSRCAEFVDAM